MLALLAEGRTNREIGEALFISPKTASVHVSNLLMKLGVANRTEAANRARERGLLTQTIGVGDLPEAVHDPAQLVHVRPTEVVGPLLGDLGLDLPGDGLRLTAPGRDPHQSGPGVRRVRHPLDVPTTLELVDQEARGLLGHLRALGQLGEPRAVGPDPGEQAALRERHLEAGVPESRQHALLDRAVRDEEQDADMRLVGHSEPPRVA